MIKKKTPIKLDRNFLFFLIASITILVLVPFLIQSGQSDKSSLNELSNQSIEWNIFRSPSGFSFSYPNNWKIIENTIPVDNFGWGPIKEMVIESPLGLKITYRDHIDGLGGGCDPESCPIVYTLKKEPILEKTKYGPLQLIRRVIKESDDVTIQSIQVGLIEENNIEVGRHKEFPYYLVFSHPKTTLASFSFNIDLKNVDKRSKLDEYFANPEVKTAEQILRTFSF